MSVIVRAQERASDKRKYIKDNKCLNKKKKIYLQNPNIFHRDYIPILYSILQLINHH